MAEQQRDEEALAPRLRLGLGLVICGGEVDEMGSGAGEERESERDFDLRWPLRSASFDVLGFRFRRRRRRSC